jgi:hypothetical protein
VPSNKFTEFEGSTLPDRGRLTEATSLPNNAAATIIRSMFRNTVQPDSFYLMISTPLLHTNPQARTIAVSS